MTDDRHPADTKAEPWAMLAVLYRILEGTRSAEHGR
jgi:hypothetical protein